MVMDKGLISSFVESVIRLLPGEMLKEGLDKFIDSIENKIVNSTNKVDDALILPILRGLRGQLGISEEVGSKYEDKPTTVTLNVNVVPATDATVTTDTKK